MSNQTSRISITEKVSRRIGAAMDAYRTRAATERARKAFMAPRKREPKGKEAANPANRMYLQNERLLPEHGKEGENIHRRTRG